MVFCVPSIVNASETDLKVSAELVKDEDNAPIIGKFVPDKKYQQTIAEKEKKADEYYLARKSGSKDASQLLLDFAEFTGANTKELLVIEAGSKSQYQDRVISVPQKDQETNYWCGYAAMQSVLSHKSISMTQQAIADYTYDSSDSLAWYTINGSSRSQFPAAIALDDLTGYYYCPYPYGAAGGTTVTTSALASKVCASIDLNYGVLACGTSKKSSSHASHFPGYPTYKNVTHWVAVRGYYDYGDDYAIVDPAKSSAVSWSSSINAYYSVSDSKLAAYSTYRGIIW